MSNESVLCADTTALGRRLKRGSKTLDPIDGPRSIQLAWGPILSGLTGEPIVRPPVGSCPRWMSIVAYIDWSTSSNRKTRLRMDTESTGWKIENLLPGRRDFQRLAVKYERYAESFLGMLQLASSLMLPGIY